MKNRAIDNVNEFDTTRLDPFIKKKPINMAINSENVIKRNVSYWILKCIIIFEYFYISML